MEICCWFSGMLDVVLMTTVGVVGMLLAGSYLNQQRFTRIKFAKLYRNQNGGAYTLNFVLALFSLFLFICVVIECGQLFLAKTGTVYSAFAAARTAIVHREVSNRERLAEQAAVQAFVPFSRGLVQSNPEELEIKGDSRLWDAYRELAEQTVNEKYFRNKELNAKNRLELSINDRTPGDPNGPLEVKVSYRYPLMFPFLGAVLGKRDGAEYSRIMTSVVTLPKELPQSEDQRLGIEYDGD